MIILFVVMGGMLYFMSRQQKKARQAQQDMQNAMKPGVEIVTIGGLHAVVDSINHEKRTVDLDAEGVILTYDLSAIRSIVTPQAANTQTQNVSKEEVSSEVKEEQTEENK